MSIKIKIFQEIEVNISLQLEADKIKTSPKLSIIKIGKHRFQRLDNYL